MARRPRPVDDRVAYVASGLLVVGVFVVGMAVLGRAGVVDTAGIGPAFVAGFVIFVAIYFVSMSVSRYL